MPRAVPIADALGAEIEGIDLSKQLSKPELDWLTDALVEHQVIFFRDQDVSPADQLRLARAFGPVEIHPAYPHVDGFPEIAVLEADREHPSKIEKWHTDMTFRPNPPLGTILRAQVIPEGRGDTLWMSLGAAWDALSPEMRERLEGKRAEHSFEHGFQESLAEPGGRERLAKALADNPPVTHPVMRTHPANGRKMLFVNSLFTTRILGMDPAESEDVLAELYEHLERPELQCRFGWRRHSIAFWDNRSTQHKPINDYWPEHRRLDRITIAGDVPA
jgi:taurine dioxygenase